MANEKKLLGLVQEHLHDGEVIELHATGSYETEILGGDSVRSGILIATDSRVVFYAKKVGGYELESFDYSKISSFEAGKNMMGGTIGFFASGNKVKMKWVQPAESAQAFAKLVQQKTSGSPSTPAATPAPEVAAPTADAEADIIDKIKRLGELHDAGVLTDDEFSSKKAELLARL